MQRKIRSYPRRRLYVVNALIAALVIIISVAVLETARIGVQISSFEIDATPVTHYTTGPGPMVVLAHGFAGSQQMMQGYALPLARAGYNVFAFEFMGHGRHSQPMSGDVSAIEGTTRLLVAQTQRVIDAVTNDNGKTVLIGHSMATDILVRAAAERDDIGPMVLISAFSQEITATKPLNLLLVSGAWEAGLRGFGLEAVQMITPDASEGETLSKDGITRRAVAAPFNEHVSVLQSRVARRETLIWLDGYFNRQSDVRILPTGWAILGLLGGLVALFYNMISFLPAREPVALPPSRLQMVITLGAPVLVAPLLAVPLKPSFLPVLVADYLMLHLLIFGVIQLGLLRFWRATLGRGPFGGLAMLLAFCAIFAFALDRYAANFMPTSERLWIIAIILLGTLPYMVADTVLSTQASLLRRACLRGGFLVSLAIAVFLDFEGLFFLIMIAPVLLLFYAVFGTIGRSAAAKSGPLPCGMALGFVLAWALGVSFPLFQP
ncbi:hypothetical protein ROLI_018150 [Roseobacter fucihabitans]|uniref:Serine aminopeptidase S33 domain-containing protein n=1 Tax=Roseobacter fucihabitans TaxID=1537242 RepID=A0ABZ2BRR2_9RHOB|nr:alpha/beta fold hydrolase [Roseobacter litoralis]MBC6965574.1 Alpha/beta hydrolase family protein [Roseobacter litoralis]